MLENQMQRDLGARSLQLQPLRMSHEGFLEGLRRWRQNRWFHQVFVARICQNSDPFGVPLKEDAKD